MMHWDFTWAFHYKQALLLGVWYTVKLNLFVALIGSILGMLIAFAKLSNRRSINMFASGYIELFRAFPVLVLLIWIHYVLPAIIGLTFTAMTDAIIALSLNLSAVVADIIRSGLQSIPKGHIDAAKAIGMTNLQVIKRITLPVAVKRMMPSLVSQYVNVIKLSALASVIGVPELLHTASDLITATYRPLEFYTIVAVLFLIIILPLTWLSKKLELRAHI